MSEKHTPEYITINAKDIVPIAAVRVDGPGTAVGSDRLGTAVMVTPPAQTATAPTIQEHFDPAPTLREHFDPAPTLLERPDHVPTLQERLDHAPTLRERLDQQVRDGIRKPPVIQRTLRVRQRQTVLDGEVGTYTLDLINQTVTIETVLHGEAAGLDDLDKLIRELQEVRSNMTQGGESA